MRAFVAVTDKFWFERLADEEHLDEVNFWQPSARHAFQALEVGELFLFKLHSPDDYIVGGGLFAYWTRLPVSLAWDAFGAKNGASSLQEMRARVERYRRLKSASNDDYEIGCILLQQPFFFSREQWLPVPGWHSNIVRGATYDLTKGDGAALWTRLLPNLQTIERDPILEGVGVAEARARYGEPALIQRRLGQGSFRIVVTDAYGRRCAVTAEKALPVLEASHIRPYADGGEHRVDNGLLLRSDLHILFDRGYLTVTPDYRLEVSPRLRADFDDGEAYFAWHGHPIAVPQESSYRPRPEFLTWHNENRFRS